MNHLKKSKTIKNLGETREITIKENSLFGKKHIVPLIF